MHNGIIWPQKYKIVHKIIRTRNDICRIMSIFGHFGGHFRKSPVTNIKIHFTQKRFSVLESVAKMAIKKVRSEKKLKKKYLFAHPY